MIGQCYSDQPLGPHLAVARACAALPTTKRVYLIFDADSDELLGWWVKLSAARKNCLKLPGRKQIVRFEPVQVIP